MILAFDVKIERDSQELADSLGVRIFSAEIIYHLFDAFTKYRDDYKKQKQDEFKWVFDMDIQTIMDIYIDIVCRKRFLLFV